MKNVIVLALLLIPTQSSYGAALSASALSTTCQKAGYAVSGKGKWDVRHPENVYATGQCEGFIEGWIEGIDQAILTTKTGMVVVTVKRDQIKTMWDIAEALDQYLKKNPLENGKPADTVLREILLGSDLLTLAPYGKQDFVSTSDVQ